MSTYHPSTKISVDLGLSVLCAITPKGQTYTRGEIAAVCDCSESLMWHIEQRALRKARVILARKNINFTDLLEA